MPLRDRVLGELGREAVIDIERLAERLPEASPGALQAVVARLEIEGRLVRGRGGLRAAAAG